MARRQMYCRQQTAPPQSRCECGGTRLERVCCLLVLNSVTSTPQWIRQPKPRGSLAQGAPVFPGSSRLGIEPKTPGWLVQGGDSLVPDTLSPDRTTPVRSGLNSRGNCVCVFITAGPSTKMFAWGGGGIWEDMCYERRRAEACVD
jgi:hypothetical protein